MGWGYIENAFWRLKPKVGNKTNLQADALTICMYNDTRAQNMKQLISSGRRSMRNGWNNYRRYEDVNINLVNANDPEKRK